MHSTNNCKLRIRYLAPQNAFIHSLLNRTVGFNWPWPILYVKKLHILHDHQQHTFNWQQTNVILNALRTPVPYYIGKNKK